MMLPDFSSKKHKKTSVSRWPSGFKPLGNATLIPEDSRMRTFEPSIKQELSEFPHLPQFAMDEETFDSLAPVHDEPSFDEAINPDASMTPDDATQDLSPDMDVLDAASATEELFSGADNTALPDVDVAENMLNEPQAPVNNVADDALQHLLDQIDGAVKSALEPLKFEVNQTILEGFQSVLRKSVEADGKKRIVDFISTLVPTSQEMVATIKGPAALIEGLQAQLEARENLPVKLKFVEENGLLDIVVTYDTSSVSTRLAEFEALIAELG